MSAPNAFRWGPPGAVLSQLIGPWQFDRTVSGQATMSGEAMFAPRADGRVDYRESGTLRLEGGQEFAAYRAYAFEATPAGFMVFFGEEPLRLFQDVALTGEDALRGEAQHWCTPDDYRSCYIFGPGEVFLIRHDVSGPRKGYVIATDYRR